MWKVGPNTGRRHRFGLVLTALHLAACGTSPEGGAVDAGASDGDAAGDSAAAVTPIRLPELLPCPDGWREVLDIGDSTVFWVLITLNDDWLVFSEATDVFYYQRVSCTQ